MGLFAWFNKLKNNTEDRVEHTVVEERPTLFCKLKEESCLTERLKIVLEDRVGGAVVNYLQNIYFKQDGVEDRIKKAIKLINPMEYDPNKKNLIIVDDDTRSTNINILGALHKIDVTDGVVVNIGCNGVRDCNKEPDIYKYYNVYMATTTDCAFAVIYHCITTNIIFDRAILDLGLSSRVSDGANEMWLELDGLDIMVYLNSINPNLQFLLYSAHHMGGSSTIVTEYKKKFESIVKEPITKNFSYKLDGTVTVSNFKDLLFNSSNKFTVSGEGFK